MLIAGLDGGAGRPPASQALQPVQEMVRRFDRFHFIDAADLAVALGAAFGM